MRHWNNTGVKLLRRSTTNIIAQNPAVTACSTAAVGSQHLKRVMPGPDCLVLSHM